MVTSPLNAPALGRELGTVPVPPLPRGFTHSFDECCVLGTALGPRIQW